MAFNILEHVTLAYQPIWGANRQMVGVRLFVHALDPHSVDAEHLLKLLDEEWSEQSPFLVVSFADAPQLLQALRVQPRNGHWLEVPYLGPHPSQELVNALAHARSLGHRLIQSAPQGSQVAGNTAPTDSLRYLWDLNTQQAATATYTQPTVFSGHLCRNAATREQADYTLDTGKAWGVCGWPHADVLQQHSHHGISVDKRTIVRVQQALMHDQPMDVVEDLIHQDLVLTYRLLRLVNSAVFGTGRQVQTTRQAIMLLGQKKLRDWLLEQLPGASAEADLQPVRQSMVLRARLMEYLMDAGWQDDLRTEIYVTGLFSFLPLVTNEPLATAIKRVPVSEPIAAALLGDADSPYTTYLDIARCLEYAGNLAQLEQSCVAAEFPLDQANRALVRMLAHWRNVL